MFDHGRPLTIYEPIAALDHGAAPQPGAHGVHIGVEEMRKLAKEQREHLVVPLQLVRLEKRDALHHLACVG